MDMDGVDGGLVGWLGRAKDWWGELVPGLGWLHIVILPSRICKRFAPSRIAVVCGLWPGVFCCSALLCYALALSPQIWDLALGRPVISCLPLPYHHTRRLVFLFYPLLCLSCRFFCTPLRITIFFALTHPSVCRSFSFLIASPCLESKLGLAQRAQCTGDPQLAGFVQHITYIT